MEAVNSGKPYTDDQLRLIFSHPPTKDNCAKLAAILGRTPNTIVNIYQWAAYPDKTFEAKIQNGQPVTNNTHLVRIRAISKEMGWIRGVTK